MKVNVCTLSKIITLEFIRITTKLCLNISTHFFLCFSTKHYANAAAALHVLLLLFHICPQFPSALCSTLHYLLFHIFPMPLCCTVLYVLHCIKLLALDKLQLHFSALFDALQMCTLCSIFWTLGQCPQYGILLYNVGIALQKIHCSAILN